MLRCNHCFFVAIDESNTTCRNCGQTLRDSKPLRRTRSLASPNPTAHLVTRNKHVGKLGRHEVAIYMLDMDEPLIATVTDELVLGRTSRVSAETAQPTVDFTTFQAVERGVSRAHAALRRFDRALAVIDLGSTNGTWLNNARLTPNLPVIISNGDRVALAKLSMYIYYHD